MNKRGFTLIEILLSVTILGMLVMMSAPIYFDAQTRNELTIATQTIAQSVWRAQELSRASVGDSVWGVDVRDGSITVFQGVYGSDYDEVFDLSDTISVTSSPQAVTFAKLSGEPDSAIDITLTSESSGQERTVTINAKGMVDY